MVFKTRVGSGMDSAGQTDHLHEKTNPVHNVTIIDGWDRQQWGEHGVKTGVYHDRRA